MRMLQREWESWWEMGLASEQRRIGEGGKGEEGDDWPFDQMPFRPRFFLQNLGQRQSSY